MNKKRFQELAGLNESMGDIHDPAAYRLWSIATSDDDFISKCEGSGIPYHRVVDAVEDYYSKSRDEALSFVATRWKELPKGGLAPLNEGRSYEVCNAHKAFDPNCKQCQKRKALMENMPKPDGFMRMMGGPPHDHAVDEDIKSLFTYSPGGPRYDERSYDNMVREMYGGNIPEYIVECMNEATTSGQFIDMVRSQEEWNDEKKEFVYKPGSQLPPRHDEELWKLVCEMTDKTMDLLRETAKRSSSTMNYKEQHMLEQLIERLGHFHLRPPQDESRRGRPKMMS